MTNTRISLIAIYALFFSALAINTVRAEQSVEFDDFVVHYNAINTNFLDAAVAKMYGIKRSKNRAMLTVSVLKKHIGLSSLPIQANVTATAVNPSNQIKTMSMREITDGGAIYYIGEFPISDNELLNFTIGVTPDGSQKESFDFRQEFVSN